VWWSAGDRQGIVGLVQQNPASKANCKLLSLTVLFTVPSLPEDSFGIHHNFMELTNLQGVKTAGLFEFAVSHKIVPVPVTKHRQCEQEFQ
jgi:hypothetical protein